MKSAIAPIFLTIIATVTALTATGAEKDSRPAKMAAMNAEADKGKWPQLSAEQREKRAVMADKMSAAHAHMATCLRSPAKHEDCFEGLLKECDEAFGGKGHCPMAFRRSGKLQQPAKK